MDDFQIVDPHQHFWDLSLGRHPWLIDDVKDKVFGDYAVIRKNYLLPDYLADVQNQNVVKSVHVEADCGQKFALDETRWLQEHADRYGFPHGIVGHTDLDRADAGDALDAHMEAKNFRGIRHTLCYDPDPRKSFNSNPDLIRSVEFRRGFKELQRRGLSFDLAIYYNQVPDACKLASDFSETQFILGHAALPFDKSPEAVQAWRLAMTELARMPNVATKISGFGVSLGHWTYEELEPYVLHLIEAFGVDRCMFASNFPVDKLFKSYDEVFNTFKSITKDFSNSERKKMFRENAERVYRI